MTSRLLAFACSLALSGGLAAAGTDGATQHVMRKSASAFEGTEIVNQAGDALGRIDTIVRDNNTGELHAVVSVGGWLGIGAKQVAIPIEHLRTQGDELLAPVASTEDELAVRRDFVEDLYSEVPDGVIVEVENLVEGETLSSTPYAGPETTRVTPGPGDRRQAT